MKKIIISLICVLMVVALSVCALADGTLTASVSAGKTTIARGESVVVTVAVSEFANCTGGSLKIEYDSNRFTRSDNKWTLAATPIMSDANGDAVFAYGSSAAATVSGNIYQFTLTAKSDAAFSASDVSVYVKLNGTDGSSAEDRKSVSITVACSHSYDNDCDTDCNVCGQTREAKHSWNGGEVTQKPGCTTAGEKTYTCTVCGTTKNEPVDAAGHAYDSDCDTECNNGCGTTREAKHSYNTTKWYSDGTNHWHQCTVCGDKTDVTAHTPGDAATEWAAQTCTVCNHVLQSALGHTHKYGTVWIFDEMGHWHECSGCEELDQYTDHVYENTCDTTCDTCGYKREIQHTLGDHWWFDATGHWQECTVCGEKSRPEPHNPGPEATATSAQNCIDCGYEIAPMLGHTHDFGTEWLHDASAHWQQCDCGTVSIPEAHIWSEGTVVKEPTASEMGEMLYICTSCDAEKRESIPMLEETQPTEPAEPTEPSTGTDPEPQPKEFPWWILVVIGGILVLGFVIFMIVGAILGQKQTGKFSEK